MRISMTRWTWPEVSPFFHSARRERLKYQASPVSIVFCSASAFMCATISTSPVATSVATQVISPSASNFGAKARPSSTCSAEAKSPLPAANHGDDAHLLVRVFAERAAEVGGDRERAGLLDPAQRHAHVLGFKQNRDAARLENFLDRGRDLRGHVLLRLQAARIAVDEARELREPHHAIDRHIGDVRLA